MHFLHQWVQELLVKWEVLDAHIDLFATCIVLAGLVLVAIIMHYGFRTVLRMAVRRITRNSKRDWDTVLSRRKIIIRLAGIIPAIFLYLSMPQAFPTESSLAIVVLLRRLCIVYIIWVLTRFVYALLDLIDTILQGNESVRNRTVLKGLFQALQILVIFIGIIFMVSVLINRSPNALLTGLGASAAILMLVFKDLILGFVAGIRLSTEDTLRVGDWITVPKYGADGDVIEVSIGSVKVRNFDNTIVTLPPYALVSESFQNWRGMSESGGRRIKRAVYIDMNSVKFCTPEMLERYRKISLLSDYIDSTEQVLKSYNNEHHIDESVKVNGRRQTNLGVFRAYLESYLKYNSNINHKLTCMVRQLQPTEMGIPLELYCFTADTRWIQYENIQSDIFDHIIASIPEFDLAVFQNIAGNDLRSIPHAGAIVPALKEPA